MNTKKIAIHLTFLVMMLMYPVLLNAQMNFIVNSLADDEFSYAWDDPATPEDESMDGICNDELGRCTLGAAYGESFNMNLPVNIGFSVSGTIDLINTAYLFDGSTIDGGGQIELSNIYACMSVENNTTVKGLKFISSFGVGLTVNGDYNKIGVFETNSGNEFVGSTVGLIVTGDSNEVYSNYIGITKNKVLIPNNYGMMVFGNYNSIGKMAYFANIICGNSTGIIIGGSEFDGRYNTIRGNVIGTTFDNELGLGNQQGILVEGAISNFIESNTVAGNTIHGIAIIGAPPKSHSSSNVISWNNIGINYFQNLAIPNKHGIVITDGTWLTDINNNNIGGNDQIGIFVKGINDTVQTKFVLIHENYIGVNRDLVSFPNNTGIVVEGNVNNIWIGSIIGQDYGPNYVIGNTNAGIVVKPGLGGYAPEKVTFRKNVINQNIVMNLFVDPVANLGIQPPHDLLFSGTLLTGIHQISNAVIDIYDVNILEGPPSAYRWLGSTTTDANGIFAFDITDPLVEAVSVTASTSVAGTSSFAYLELVTDVEYEEQLPTEFSLLQNYPNPFNPSTTIKYSIPSSEFVTLKVFDVLGKEVATLVNGEKPVGSYEVDFIAAGLSSGMYFYKLQAGNPSTSSGQGFVETRKMLLLK
jgi:hypothetical protein